MTKPMKHFMVDPVAVALLLEHQQATVAAAAAAASGSSRLFEPQEQLQEQIAPLLAPHSPPAGSAAAVTLLDYDRAVLGSSRRKNVPQLAQYFSSGRLRELLGARGVRRRWPLPHLPQYFLVAGQTKECQGAITVVTD